QAYAAGAAVDWEQTLPADARVVDLPTYAFQHTHYWLQNTGSAGDVTSAGLEATEHTLLSASLPLAESDRVVLTGRISLRTHPWLADHAVTGTVLLPGTAFVEMAVRAGDEVGCAEIVELTLLEPLVLEPSEAVQVQVTVGAADENGRRQVDVHSRAADQDNGFGSWNTHATGVLAAEPVAPSAGPASWPPAGAEPVELGGGYDDLLAQGYEYGPVFQGLKAAWRHGDDIYAEVALPEGASVNGFALHPALLDAALHALGTVGATEGADTSQGVRLPFAWNGVSVHAAGATFLRVRLTPEPAGDRVRVGVFDGAGAPVATVEELVLRAISAEQLSAAAGTAGDTLYRTDWVGLQTAPGVSAAYDGWAVVGADAPGLQQALKAGGEDAAHHPDLAGLAAAVVAGAPAPAVVLAPLATSGTVLAAADARADVPGAVRAATGQALTLVQEWLAEETFAESRLVLVTGGAVATEPGGAPDDLGLAAVWGLVRAAEAENPGRFVLVDLDDDPASRQAVPVTLTTGEPEVAVRGGRLLGRRLHAVTHGAPKGAAGTAEPTDSARTTEPTDSGPTAEAADSARIAEAGDSARTAALARPAFDTSGTVLLTGGTGTLGALLARHLVTRHGVRQLLVTSRRGPAAEGAAELRDELTRLGATVTVAACDVADGGAVRRLLDGIPAEHPLTAVIHTAGVTDDGVVAALDAGRLDAVMRPKVDAAVHLDELTRHPGVGTFVLFSSAAGTIGSPGQANYGAANAFIDALAARRRAAGLPAVSLAWGFWEQRSELTARLGEADVARMNRSGVTAMPSEAGLALFDAALGREEAVLVPVRFDLPAVRARLVEHGTPAVLRDLVRLPSRRSQAQAALSRSEAEALLQRLAALSAEERTKAVLDLVRTHVAAVLGFAGPRAVAADRGFLELGFDSLTALELRNRLTAATGLRLPATLIFDYPSADALAGFVVGELPFTEAAAAPSPVHAELERLEKAVAGATVAEDEKGEIAERLQTLLVALGGTGGELAARIDEASDDEMFAFIDNELGLS
ncbi:type I polyketide synthase, partial [Streptomyces sp. NPDC059169]|uniref:type I polyketide synthase n=1 Tax=Streptomyces sp. NPDC059169 TaxID=3346754 RepID=UPI0036B99D5D